MCEKKWPELLAYCSALSKLIREGELPYSPQVVHELVPYWSEEQRLSQERKFMRGAVDVFSPPTLFPGAHLLRLSSSRIVFGGFQLGYMADMTEARNFASQKWAANMLIDHPSEALLCTVIHPWVSRDDKSEDISLLMLLDSPLEEIEREAVSARMTLRDCLKNHIQRYTTCEIGIREFGRACKDRAVRVQHIEVCGGCSRHIDVCNCFKPSGASSSAIFAVPCQIMTEVAANFSVSTRVLN